MTDINESINPVVTDANDIESLRKAWHAVEVDRDKLEKTNRKLESHLHSERRETIARELVRNYREALIPCFAVILLSPVVYFVLHTPIWMAALYLGYGIVMSAVYLSMMWYVGNFNFYSLPVKEALEKVVKLRMYQRRILLWGFAGLIPVLAPLLYFLSLNPNSAVLTGAIVGGLIGLAIGIAKELRFFRNSRRLLRELQTTDED